MGLNYNEDGWMERTCSERPMNYANSKQDAHNRDNDSRSVKRVGQKEA